MVIEIYSRIFHFSEEQSLGKNFFSNFLDLKFVEKMLLNHSYTIYKNYDYSLIFALVALLEVSNFFEVFRNFQVEFYLTLKKTS